MDTTADLDPRPPLAPTALGGGAARRNVLAISRSMLKKTGAVAGSQFWPGQAALTVETGQELLHRFAASLLRIHDIWSQFCSARGPAEAKAEATPHRVRRCSNRPGMHYTIKPNYTREGTMRKLKMGTRGTATVLAGMTAAILPAAVPFVAPAAAAPYAVASCQYPDNTLAPADGWVSGVSGSPYTYFDNACGSGSGLNTAFDAAVGHAYGTQGSWTFTAPANTTLTSVSAQRSAVAGPTQPFGTPAAVIFTEKGMIDSCSQLAGCTDKSGPIQYDLAGASTLVAGVQCGGGPGGECPAGGLTQMSIRQIGVTLDDDSSPQLTSPPAGSLTSPTATTRIRSLSYNATDTGSGIHRHKLIVDGNKTVVNTVPDTNGGKCATYAASGRYAYRVPCKLSLGSTLNFDTSTLSDGAHEVALAVSDATDQNIANAGPWPIVVDNQAATVTGVKVTGTARVGENLACTGTTGGQNPVLSYQWLRSGAGSSEAVIVGADKPSYTLVAADAGSRLICALTATDAGGATTARSSGTDGPFADGTLVKGLCEGLKSCETNPSSPTLPGAGGGAPPISATNGINGEPNNGLSATNIATFKLQSLGTRTVKWGQRTAVVGRLLNANGQPIANAVVTVTQRTILPRQDGYAPGSQDTTLGSIKTDAKGVMRFLVPIGASREIAFNYKANLLNSSFQSRQGLRLNTIAATTLKLSRKVLHNGSTLTLTGRVLSTPVPRSGLVINLQVFIPGRGWTVFKSPRTNRAGAFVARYRFTRTMRPTRYRFRAVLRADGAYPYVPGHTGTRTALVSP